MTNDLRLDVHFHIDGLTLNVNVNHTVSVDRALFALINSIKHEVHSIMATQAELAAQLAAVKVQLDTIGAGVDKVSGETSTLVQAVADLTAALAAGSATTPEVDAALAAVQASSDALAAKVKAVDDLVPDAAPAP